MRFTTQYYSGLSKMAKQDYLFSHSKLFWNYKSYSFLQQKPPDWKAFEIYSFS